MIKKQFVLGVALLATVAWGGSALGALFHDYFPTGADGSMNTYYGGEGYAISDEGGYRFAKLGQHFGFWDFATEFSDGPDTVREGINDTVRGQDHLDGWYLGKQSPMRGTSTPYGPSPAWYTGKKIVSAGLYMRNMNSEFCGDSVGYQYAYIREPITFLGFRCGNVGPFNDRGYKEDTNAASPTYHMYLVGSAAGGCCAGYRSPLLLPGENGPPAWRMGIRENWTGDLPNPNYPTEPNPIISGSPWVGYQTDGAIGAGATLTSTPTNVTITPEYWKISSKEPATYFQDATNPNVANPLYTFAGAELKAQTSTLAPNHGIVSMPFDHDGDGFGGNSGPINGSDTSSQDALYGFSFLVRRSKAHIVNTQLMTYANCTRGPLFNLGFGEYEPRDISNDGEGSFGWFGLKIDPVIVAGMAATPDALGGANDAKGGIKGLVANGLTVSATTGGAAADNATMYGRDQGAGRNSGYGPYLELKATYAGDVNNDGTVNVTDLNLLVAKWGSTGNPQTNVPITGSYDNQSDFNLDGYINVGDLQPMILNWAKVVPAGGY